MLTLDRLEHDPHSIWNWLRENDPVAVTPALGLTLVTRHTDVERVCRDHGTFSSSVADSTLVQTLGPNMINSDGDHHLRLRSLVAPLVQARSIRDNYSERIHAAAVELLARNGDHVDIATQYARPLAELLITKMLGIPSQAPGTLERWFRGIAAGAANFESNPDKSRMAEEASDEIDAVLRQALQVEQVVPGSLMQRFREAEGFTFQDLSSTAKLFIIGGLQEPRDLIAMTATALLTHPDALHAVASNPILLARAIEETARWEAPVGTVVRMTTTDVTLSGHLIKQGTTVAGVIASANRDPHRWTQPDNFVLSRDEGPHLAFAVGAHACIGAPAARMLVREALAPLLERLRQSRLVEPVTISGYEFRGPQSVLINWR